ncbi:hypothetical protein DL98DRAFT_266259 [Cadophora sp. DSE1049]|nr:hypothetical protein DL98DRAFT_266259 [Cadophora sp. DSE1049]
MRSMRADFMSISTPPSKDVLDDLNRGLKAINSKQNDAAFKVETGPTLYKVLCSDCPHWSNYCPLQASTKRIADTVNIAEKHTETDRYKQQIQKKLDAIKKISDRLPELCDRYPGSKLEVKVQPFGLGTPWITCAACLKWIHKTFTGELLPMTIANVEKHLKSADHDDALDTVMKDAANPNTEEVEHSADEVTNEIEESTISEPKTEGSGCVNKVFEANINRLPMVSVTRTKWMWTNRHQTFLLI